MMGERIYLGLDVGGTNLVAGAVTESGVVRSLQQTPTLVGEGPTAVIARCAALLQRVRTAAGAGAELVAVGVGMPGPLDVPRGLVLYAPNFPGWRDVPLVRLLAEALATPAYMENDARMVTYGEFRFGAGRPYRDLVGITLGTGIGSGIILDGRLRTGLTGTAGEVGHATIDPDGLRCGCGNQGCLETLAAGPAIANAMRRSLLNGRPSVLADGDPSTLTAGDVGRAAAAGDATAREVLAQAGHYLGIACANLINILNPEAIIIGGGVAQAGELLFEPIRRTARLRGLRGVAERTAILPAALGDEAGVRGAAAWAQDSAAAGGK